MSYVILASIVQDLKVKKRHSFVFVLWYDSFIRSQTLILAEISLHMQLLIF